MKCEICQNPTKETLIYEVTSTKVMMFDWQSIKKQSLCHQHLIQEFTRRFTEFPHKLVVFYPDLEAEKKNFAYAFLPLAKLREFAKDLSPIDRGMSDLEGGFCARCGQPARVAYFGRHTLPRKEDGEAQIIQWKKPLGKQIEARAETLCLKCAAEAIVPSLKLYEKFNSGLCAPYNEDGVFVTLLV